MLDFLTVVSRVTARGYNACRSEPLDPVVGDLLLFGEFI